MDVPEGDTQSMTEDPPDDSAAPAAADGGEGDDPVGGDRVVTPVPSYEPVEVEFNRWDTGTSEGIYRWRGTELRYAPGDATAYVWTSLTTSNSGLGVRFRFSCSVREDGAITRSLALIDADGGVHRIFSAAPDTWRWSDKYTDRWQDAVPFDGPFTSLPSDDGATWAVATPSDETWQRLTTANLIRVFYQAGRNYAELSLPLAGVWDSYVGDNLRNCSVSVFPEWARKQLDEDRDLRQLDDGTLVVTWRGFAPPEPVDGLQLIVSCVIKEGGTGQPVLALTEVNAEPGGLFDWEPAQWRWSPFQGAGFKDAMLFDSPFRMSSSTASGRVAIHTSTEEMWSQLTQYNLFRIVYGDGVWRTGGWEASLVDLWGYPGDDRHRGTRVGDNLRNCFDLSFPRLGSPSGGQSGRGGGGVAGVY